MQKKKLISIAIALTLQSYYIPAIAAENNDDEKECPSNISSLPKEKRAKLSPTCLATPENDNHWGWVAGGVAALVAGVAIGVENNGGGDSNHSYTPPTPDNGGDVTPPDDGGNVTPPDDGGDDNVIPPDDSGDDDVTPPDDSGDDDVTPPDDSGDDDVTPPDDSGDDDVTPPDDSGDDDVTPPDDSGDDDDTPPDDSVITFSNGVTIDKGKDTLTFDSFKLDNGSVLEGAVWNYSELDNQWQLTTADGKTLNVTDWDVTDANAAVIEGTQENGLYWKYDSRGYLIIADDKTTVISGDDQAHNSDRGMDISGQDRTGVIISGDRTVNTLTGDSSVTDGATGMVISGDGTTNTISGHSTVDNATGALISGNGTTTNFAGDIAVSGGGTAIIIDGDNATIKNTGTSDISGAGSTGTVINGNNARVNNDGDMTITDGGTGAHITGDDVVIDNAGSTTVSGADATALYIDGDNALVINEGNQTISGGAVGTRIDGDDAHITNTGDIAVDGADSAAVVINGDNGSLTQAGDLLVTNGAMGIITYGTGNEAKNTGNATVRDADSVGFVVAGEKNTFKNKGDLDVSLNGTGTQVSGDMSQVTLDGDINVTAVEDSDSVYRGATGIDITGDNNTLDIVGNVTVNGDYDNDSVMAGSTDTLQGMSVSGDNNQVDLTGTLNINVSDMSNVDGQYLNAVGLSVTGDGNSVDLTGGININYTQDADGIESPVVGININGDSSVTLSGQSTLDITSVTGGAVTLAYVQNGGNLTLDQSSTINVNSTLLPAGYYMENALLTATGQGSTINNQGTIVDNGAVSLLLANSGAQGGNSGDITAYATTGEDNRNAITAANGQGSTFNNETGGTITVVSSLTPVVDGGAFGFPLAWRNNTLYAMLAEGYGEVSNDAGAHIYLQGAGVYGVSASKGTASNAGDIYLDGLVPTLDDENHITDKTYWAPPQLYVTSSAMVAGSTDGGYGDATAINTGTITVNNAGFGMMALNGGTAINQGVITLTADDGVTGQANELVGMAALSGGTVINDTSGIINIDADYGQPFLTDGSGTVVNYGTVCYDSACQNSDEYNPTDSNVSLSFRDGDEITAEGETLTGETIITNPVATETVHVSNAGTVSDGKVIIKNYGDVTNESTGSISSVSIETGGIYTNDGTTVAVSVDGGVFNNTGTVTGKTGTTVAGSVINNSGSMNTVEQWASTMNNTGTVTAWTGASGSAVLNNNTGGEVDKLTFTAAATVNNAGVIKNGSVDKSGTLNNLEDGVMTLADNGLWSGTFNNWGTVNSDADIATGGNGHTLYNGSTGVINGQITTSKNNGGSKAINDGTINIDKTNNVAMSAHGSAKMVNNGTINVGTVGTTQTGMVGMQLESDAKSDAVIENNGTINIYASNSYAFSQLGSNGHIVNNGTVYIDDSVTGSGFIKQDGKTIEGSGENGDGTEVHYVDFTAPTEPTITDGTTTVTTSDSADSSATNNLSGYVVGTSADGSAGKLMVSNASMNGVEINTGFTAGTADTTVSFDNVVEGSNLSDAGAIQSTSVVWNAQGSQDADGNVDVTMTKNAYADVATDGSVSDVAQALDAGYTNNELYTSLNVGTTAELNSALKQVSGAQATTVFREARVLSNRFTMLADAAPQIKDGLAFNVVAKGDPRAELGNDTQYDMLALRQTLDLTASQNLTLEYGIARLDGDGSKTAGDNGLTGGYSQFFGLKHSMAFDEGLAWNNSLRYDVHNLDSSRSVAYGDVNKIADSDMRQQYLEFRSEGAKTFTMMSDTLKVTPYAGVKFRHTMEDGYKERSAGDFNLSMNSGNETAVDSIVGLKLDYAGKDGWSATATLEGGPNLSYSKSQRTASLQGAAGQSFGVDDGQKGGGVNGLATIGVKYSSNDTALHLDAYQWKEDGISDKGFMLNVKKTFR
ncbi:autotransporter domain-containing protein [Salmonella enterica subsp. enterica]|uniref:BigA/YdbA N-terminal beta-barrel domain-containing protein n=1 Tax=Salmonella enterica TaxID=28901 RepID=UPI00069B43EA|nr:autotransporter domain-containing protein [Salmonella enterica]EDU9913911.1 autotransporter domain-containing protein [Salmonella enterica subsp. enterica]EAW1513787.1 autotransporter domain-containing protein [Salmonella enterica]EBT7738989.1 autotransporter domain-containing protein [Salmonella enterica]ECR7284651.1 autotransporter domain-containing protein [Salmonella enterica]EDE2407098.1 autotransporter domain-containing protein [Salmonella enterica]